MFLVCLALNEDRCTIEANTSVNITYVESCFRGIPSDPVLNNETLDSISQLSLIYVFRGQAKSENDYDIAAVDIDQELKTLRESTPSSDFEFHEKVAYIFHKLYDAHTKYVLPQGYGSFTLVQGVVPVYNETERSYVLEAVRSDPQPVFDSVVE